MEKFDNSKLQELADFMEEQQKKIEALIPCLKTDEEEEELSPCCSAPIEHYDLCSECKEHI